VVVAVVDSAGNLPPSRPPVVQAIDHHTVADTVNRPPGAPADPREYACPHVGDAAAGSVPARHGVPGPSHVTDAPSPVDHTTRDGVAVAVTTTPGTAADADRALHCPESIHNHIGKCTSCLPLGLKLIGSDGSFRWLTACWARACGEATAGTRKEGPPLIHRTPPPVPGVSAQVYWYHPPGLCPGPPRASCSSVEGKAGL
jgi:hypothetical protein